MSWIDEYARRELGFPDLRHVDTKAIEEYVAECEDCGELFRAKKGVTEKAPDYEFCAGCLVKRHRELDLEVVEFRNEFRRERGE